MTAVPQTTRDKKSGKGGKQVLLASARRARKERDARRRCLVTGELKERADLIRFVLGPEGAVVPDLKENLPGHGLWVTASKEAIETARAKNLFAKAAKAAAKPAHSLAEDTIGLLRKRCLDLLGLSKGAGIAVLGETQTREALHSGDLALYVHAQDAAHILDGQHNTSRCDLFTRDELGAAFGYGEIVHAGLSPHGLTEKMQVEIRRLQSMINGKNEG